MTNTAISTTDGMFNSDMSTIQKRLETFHNWPSSKRQKAEDLSKCGFYYLGESDKVRCFYCGVGLHDWLSEDNVWLEHAISSNACPYLLLNKRMFNNDLKDAKFSSILVSYKSLVNLDFQNYFNYTCEMFNNLYNVVGHYISRFKLPW